MILSLEEEDPDDDLADNVMTLDGELMAVNGRVLSGQQFVATSERNICAAANAQKDTASVCSCTCYGRRRTGGNKSQQNPNQQQRSSGTKMLWCVGKMFGCRESVTNIDEENFYDAETQSISNYTRYAVKRASF